MNKTKLNDKFSSLEGCPYKGECKSEGIKCSSCANNSDKEDHYRPRDGPYGPYTWPPYPVYPHTTVKWYG